MSLRYEQQRSLWETRRLLYDIVAGRATNVQEWASYCLRHYPLLDEYGAPMFSRDGFECPRLDMDAYLGCEGA